MSRFGSMAVVWLVAALLLAAVPAAGSAQESSPAAGGGPYVAEDAAGQTLNFDEPVERVVCLQTGCDEILADLGLLPAATVVTPFNAASPLYYGERAAEVVTLADAQSVEEVASFEPDLIYVREGMDEAKAAMEAVAPVFVGFAGFEATPAVYAENVRDLGALTGRTAEAEAAIARFDGVLAAIVGRAPAGAADLRFAIVAGFDPEGYFLHLRGSIFCNVIEQNGLGRCAIATPAAFDETFGEIDAEVVLDADPDLIGYISRDGEAGPDERTDQVWEQLTAVREGRVYVDASDGLYCCGLRHIQYSLELYAFHAFPDAGYPEPAPYLEYDPTRPASSPASAAPAATPTS